MKRSSSISVLVVAIFVFMVCLVPAALAAPANSGTVYGQAQMTPLVGIEISGQGSDEGSPLVYQGHTGDEVNEAFNREVHVSNTGDCPLDLAIACGQNPTDGSDSWEFGGSANADTAVWAFSSGPSFAQVPPYGTDAVSLLTNLPAGNDASFQTIFDFPTTYHNANVHNMTALITASVHQ